MITIIISPESEECEDWFRQEHKKSNEKPYPFCLSPFIIITRINTKVLQGVFNLKAY